ncbi:hypothetical protein LR004_01965, partial [Candidatus Gracilibacteria bacterium]|nr:hypothetical protein [Candidatus Gracilibacteria bacterium]
MFKIIILLSLFLSSSFSKGEVSKIFAHKEKASNTTYTADGKQHKWGRGDNLVIDAFEYDGKRYNYVSNSPIVKIRRVNNNEASNEPCGLFAERSGNNYTLEASFPQTNGNCDMAKVMAGRTINVGALDLFRNVGYTAKNVERVDFISPNGIFAPYEASNLSKAGHVVTEKQGNNYLQIAAILSIDANNTPTSFGPLVMVHKYWDNSANVRYGLCNIYLPDNSSIYNQSLGFYVDNTNNNQGKPWHIQTTSEPLGMAFVTLEDLGVSANQKYYGFSYFGRDVNTNNDILTDVTTFPTNTGGDTADPYGGVASYFVDEALSSSLSINDVSKNEGNSGQTNFDFTVTLSKALNHDISVDYTTQNDTATTTDNDYVAKSATLTFLAGELTKTISIQVNGDTKDEPNETFFVNLSNPQNANVNTILSISDNQGIGTIEDEAVNPIANYHLDECSWDGTANEVKDSVGGVHGQAYSNATTTSQDGKIERSGIFDKNNADYVSFGDNFNPINTDKWSISVWFKANSNNDEHMVYSKDG